MSEGPSVDAVRNDRTRHKREQRKRQRERMRARVKRLEHGQLQAKHMLSYQRQALRQMLLHTDPVVYPKGPPATIVQARGYALNAVRGSTRLIGAIDVEEPK